LRKKKNSHPLGFKNPSSEKIYYPPFGVALTVFRSTPFLEVDCALGEKDCTNKENIPNCASKK
jgi:hypothetical protein